MNINDCAKRQLSYFSPEERSIPDADAFPGRNAAVEESLNSALQDLFGKAGKWARNDDRSARLYAPAPITVGVNNDGTAFSILTGWQSWMEGCSITIDGDDARNVIKQTASAGYASLTVNPAGTNNTFVLYAVRIGTDGNLNTFEIASAELIPELTVSVSGTDITVTPVLAITIAGTLTSNGTTPVTFPRLIIAGDSQFTSDGNTTAPVSGAWYEYVKGIGTWTARYFFNGAEVAFWESTFADPQQTDPLDPTIDLTASSPATGTPTVSSVVTTTAEEVIEAINAHPDCVDLMTASASGAVTGSVAAFAQTPLAGGAYVAILKIPYGGDSGNKSATVYHDRIDLGTDVLEVHDDVRLNGLPIGKIGVPGGNLPTITPTEDFGFRRSMPPAPATGTPQGYEIETWQPDSTSAPRLRMRFLPAPKSPCVIEYSALLCPPRVENLTSIDALPIPYGFVESIFLPIALKKLRGSPFWRGIVGDDEVESGYRNALELLGESKPDKSGGITFHPPH